MSSREILLLENIENLLIKMDIRESAAPPAESEAVQLLERVVKWWEEPAQGSAESQMMRFEFAILPDTRALLAKLKGGK